MSILRNSIYVRHNIEIAHRLSLLPGRCQNIHGHSMIVTMRLGGELDDQGILAGLDFSGIKARFRDYLDSTFDHHLLLNQNDDWARKLRTDLSHGPFRHLPGLTTFPADPTTENIAQWICEWAVAFYIDGMSIPLTAVTIDVQETGTNGAHAKWSA